MAGAASNEAEGPAKVNAALLIIGNEILSGRTQDLNLAYLGKKLNEAGIQLKEARVVADDPEQIISAVNALRTTFDYVFTTGGIGPTHDDITSACIAKAFGVPFGRNAEAEQLLLTFYGKENANPARMRMADIPEGATLIDNPVSVAPGFKIGNVHVMAGIPKIMQAMLDNILPNLQGGAPVLSRTIVAYSPESAMAPTMQQLETDFTGIEVGSYPFQRMQRFGTSIVIRTTDAPTLKAAGDQLIATLQQAGIEHQEGELSKPEPA